MHLVAAKPRLHTRACTCSFLLHFYGFLECKQKQSTAPVRIALRPLHRSKQEAESRVFSAHAI